MCRQRSQDPVECACLDPLPVFDSSNPPTPPSSAVSLGGGIASDFERDAFQTFFDDGILSIAAAGNYGDDSYWYPASYFSVMSVAATDSSDTKASFSQFNNMIDIAAPGVDIVSTVGATPARRPQRRRSPIALTRSLSPTA